MFLIDWIKSLANPRHLPSEESWRLYRALKESRKRPEPLAGDFDPSGVVKRRTNKKGYSRRK